MFSELETFTMSRTLPLLVLACLLAGCSIIRNPANYQASIDIWHDSAVASVPVLEAEVDRLRAAGDTDACIAVADVLVFTRFWAPYQRYLDLTAAQIEAEAVEKPTDAPTPPELCRATVVVPAPVIVPAPEN